MKNKTNLAIAGLLLLNLGTIGVLLMVKAKAEKRLANASGYLRALGNEYIDYTVQVRDTIDVSTDIEIVKPVPVNIGMTIRDRIPVRMRVGVNDMLTVPVALNIDQVVSVDTSITLPDTVSVKANTMIPVNQKFKWLWGKNSGPNMKIKADIPLNQKLSIAFTDALRFKSAIPVRFMLKDQLPVKLNLDIPVDQKIDLELGIKQQAMVGFPKQLSMKGKIPIRLDIRVKIPLKDTPIKLYLDKTADELDDMLSF